MVAIRNPDHALRTQDARPCEQCGRVYRPWMSSRAGRFCTRECAGKFHHEVTQARHAAAQPLLDPEVADKITAECLEALMAYKATHRRRS